VGLKTISHGGQSGAMFVLLQLVLQLDEATMLLYNEFIVDFKEVGKLRYTPHNHSK
jgi:hypothetical protein